jgi:hypothetical protein
VDLQEYLDHVGLKFWVPYPLELLESLEFGKCSLEYS